MMRIKESNQEKSRYEMNPSKYLIVNDYDNSPVQGGNNDLSANQSYYPKVLKDESIRQREENLRNHIRGQKENPKVYETDTAPYYGRERPKIFRSNLPKDSVTVDIDLADLSYTFPSTKNLRKLEGELEKLEYENKLKFYKNGAANGDNGSYYDPTIQERQRKILILKDRISKMDYDLSHNNKPNLEYDKETSTTQVQNPRNFDREVTNKFVTESYFYPVDKNKLANGKIDQSVNLSTHGLMAKSKYVDSDKKIETDAESVGEILGNKYIKDSQPPKRKEDSNANANASHSQIPKEKQYFVDDGQIIFKPNVQSVKIGGKKDEKDCEKEKYIDTKTVLLNSLGKDKYKGVTLMARKSDTSSEEASKANATNSSDNKSESPKVESSPAPTAESKQTPPSEKKETISKAENKVESATAAANNSSTNTI
jgi:hypothetical protein